MEYEIVWTEEAKEDIHQLLIDLLDRWGDAISDRLADSIQKATYQLSTHPYSGLRYERFTAVRQLRLKPYYRIVYTVIDAKKEVVILNVIDTRTSSAGL